MNDNIDLDELKSELKQARLAYFNLNPVISDAEYDAKKELLAKYEPDAAEIKAVGADPPKISVWEKVQHKIPMGSLDKVNTESEFLEWANKLGSDTSFLFIHKIDGSSMEVVYEHGQLIRCVTRGNGIIGEDITNNGIQIPNIPKFIPIQHEEIIIRGEVVMLKDVFHNKYAQVYANPRNTANGKLRERKSGGLNCADLIFLAFTLESSSAPKLEYLRMKALQKMGFSVPEFEVGSAAQAVSWQQSIIGNRNSIPYEIDGIVVRANNISLQEELGEINMRPRAQIAYKFESATGISQVIDIKWQVGLTGRITAVASVEPVNIGGVVITSISLHNLKLFQDLKLFKGCRILISRRNDVIPYCEKNLDAASD
jgi:DNA ligase (NAD+)